MFSNVFKTINKGINKIIGNQNKFTIKGKDYIEEKLLAEGGYGYVYIVEDPDSGHKYALKKMNYQDKEQLNHIKREIDLWRKVNNHTNIIKLLDFEISQSFVLILMELCTEGTLLDLINNRQEEMISENQALYIIREIANGISHMHSQNPPIAHRDIKIENVLRVGNNYKICDFGSTSIETLDPKKESKSSLLDKFSNFEKMTTFMYRPPEMCDPYSKFVICEKVDIWMLGCILYAILFKQHPFQDAQKLTIINAHYYIPESNKSYSEKIIDFVRLMLTPNPNNRPSANDVVNIINKWSSLKSISLPQETQEIKEKQLRNVKTNKQNLLTSDDIYRVQQEIMKAQAKKNRFKNKNDDEDINEIFDDMDFGESSQYKAKTQNIQKNERNDFPKTNNQNSVNTTNKVNEKPPGEWLIDFNQGFNANNDNSTNIQAQTQKVENNFDFDFLDNTSNGKISSNTSTTKTQKVDFADFGDFVFTSNTVSTNQKNNNIEHSNNPSSQFNFNAGFNNFNNGPRIEKPTSNFNSGNSTNIKPSLNNNLNQMGNHNISQNTKQPSIIKKNDTTNQNIYDFFK